MTLAVDARTFGEPAPVTPLLVVDGLRVCFGSDDAPLPAVDGVTLLGRLKTEQPNVMRVIHSSHVESLSPEQAQALAHAVLAKPGRPDELVVVLEWAISQRRKHLRDSVGY